MTKAEAKAMLKRIQEPEAWELQINQAAFEALDMAIEALDCLESPNSSDTISRQAAIDALWKALYTYEDETERRFQESDELNVGDWIGHRIFVQNMNDIDRQTILNLPSAQSEPAIPLSWIEGQIEWLKSLDNEFSTLTAGQILAMMNKWKDEQDG